ncbi:hypothetical protein AVEN_27513-1 [Araneus ventricosus]|uniref:Uncharacterized protein n=1 Tax=Araneus ventricosus TaxID=182803 RepID=A0A4Y2V528_ARAVE|nr:hypothetical protein AVEN_27513-1 [Araneus ventricosus]
MFSRFLSTLSELVPFHFRIHARAPVRAAILYQFGKMVRVHSPSREEARGYGRRHLFKVYVPRSPRYVVPCPLLWDSGLRESIGLTQYGELWIRFADEYYHGSSWQPRPGTG